MRVSCFESGVLFKTCGGGGSVMMGEWTAVRSGEVGYISCEFGVDVKERFEVCGVASYISEKRMLSKLCKTKISYLYFVVVISKFLIFKVPII